MDIAFIDNEIDVKLFQLILNTLKMTKMNIKQKTNTFHSEKKIH